MKQFPIKSPRVFKGDVPLLSDAEASKMAVIAKALSDPIRIQMIYLLSIRMELCTCEFEELLDLAQSKVSYHLKMLLQAGFIEREFHGSWSHYKLLDRDLLKKLQTMNGQGKEC